jgi:hypothetical protein
MTISTITSCNTDLAKCLAAEDLRCGDMVAVLDISYEYPSFLWDVDSHVLSPDELVHIRWRNPEVGRPLKVKAICLPYVLVKSPSRRYSSLDVRQCRIVRLSDTYARLAWKKFRKKKKRKRD